MRAPGRQAGYDGANLNICENLYAQSGAVTAPYHAYHHSNRVVPNETCPTGSSSVAGLEFEFAATQNPYPTEYDDALFFADYSRDCIWVMQKGADGHPAPGLIRTFAAAAANPVNLRTGRAATCSTSISTAEQSGASHTPAPTSLRWL